MNTSEKMLHVVQAEGPRQIAVTHVTIRQSITFLVGKLIVIELIAAIGVIVLHTLFISTDVADVAEKAAGSFNIFNWYVFLGLVVLKTLLMFYIIMQWLNMYYEITPDNIIYRNGFIYKKEQGNSLDHLASLRLEQGMLGRIFNYGNLTLRNWAVGKDVVLYQIHNPKKYYTILQCLLPQSDQKKIGIREHVIEPTVGISHK